MNDVIPELLPPWAIGTTTTLAPGAQLCTKDGRRTGNAVIAGPQRHEHGCTFWPVLTDAGNMMNLTDAEVESLFWPPKWLMDPATAPGAEKAQTRQTGTMGRIYIAGPMTGLPDYNYPAFHAMAAELRAAGWHVENPAEGPELPSWSAYMRRAIGQLITCDSVCMLPGWTHSRGAFLEWFIASFLGMAITYHQAPPLWMERLIELTCGLGKPGDSVRGGGAA